MDFFVLSWFCGFSTGTSLGCGISRNIGRLSPGQLRGSSWAEASSQAAVSPGALSSGPVLLQHFPQARGVMVPGQAQLTSLGAVGWDW